MKLKHFLGNSMPKCQTTIYISYPQEEKKTVALIFKFGCYVKVNLGNKGEMDHFTLTRNNYIFFFFGAREVLFSFVTNSAM